MTNEIKLVTLDRNLPITLNATKQNRNCNSKCIVNTFVFTTVSLKIYLQHLSGRSQTMIAACSQTWYLTIIWRMATSLLVVTVSVVALWISPTLVGGVHVTKVVQLLSPDSCSSHRCQVDGSVGVVLEGISLTFIVVYSYSLHALQAQKQPHSFTSDQDRNTVQWQFLDMLQRSSKNLPVKTAQKQTLTVFAKVPDTPVCSTPTPKKACRYSRVKTCQIKRNRKLLVK